MHPPAKFVSAPNQLYLLFVLFIHFSLHWGDKAAYIIFLFFLHTNSMMKIRLSVWWDWPEITERTSMANWGFEPGSPRSYSETQTTISHWLLWDGCYCTSSKQPGLGESCKSGGSSKSSGGFSGPWTHMSFLSLSTHCFLTEINAWILLRLPSNSHWEHAFLKTTGIPFIMDYSLDFRFL